MDPILLLLRDEMTRRLAEVAGTMATTMDLLTATRDAAGDVRGTEALRAAIEELGSTRDHLLDQARALRACAPGPAVT